MPRKKKSAPPWRAQIEIFESHAQLRTVSDDGLTSKAVTLDALAGALSGIPMSTGLLPQNTLYYTAVGASLHIGVYIPAGRHTLLTPERSYTIPLPGLVFAGNGRSWRLFAVKTPAGEWPAAETALYHPPVSNVYNSGEICQGEMRFPDCQPGNVWAVWEQYVVGSYFVRHLMAARLATNGVLKNDMDLFAFWAMLETSGDETFPLEMLVAHKPGKTLGDLAGGRYR